MSQSIRRSLAAFFAILALSTASTASVADANLDKVLAGAHRSEANKARDQFRNPKQTLAFFGVKDSSTVIEVWPGGGWYTEVLSPYLRDKGRYIALFPATSTRGLQNFKDKTGKAPELYDKTIISLIGVPDKLDIKPAGGADAVLTFRNVHNWLKDDLTPKYFKAFFDALKPGGVLGVVEHRAKPGTTIQQSSESGYVTEQWVIDQATAAGFKLEAKSEINANPKDTKDYAKGVWTLPPTLTLGEADKAKYQAIGESDRMTLKFVKPAK